ncbi:ClpX C4-type zinc finger protein [Ancylobacter dichloromethanicus]
MSRFATYRCTFCGALSDDVETLFAGPNHQAICDKCVSFGVARLNGEPAHDDIPGRLAKWRRAAPPTTTLHPLAEASSDGLERADKLLCVCYGSGSDPLDLGSLRGICLAEKGPAGAVP